MNLSNRSINLLKNDNVKRYKWYVLWQRESEFQTYFAIGATFGEIIEQYHKTWSWDTDRHIAKMKAEYHRWQATDEEREKWLVQINELVENAKLVITERCDRPEYENIVKIDYNYSLKCKYDALWYKYVEDYKSVYNFSKDDEAIEKYSQQIKLYQYSEYKRNGEKKRWKITEIKKVRPTLPRKKEELIAMIPEWVSKEGTVAEIRSRLYLYANKDQVSKEFWFEWDDSIISYCENLIRRAIIKANYLKSLPSLDDVL